jgi:hypothetical protein
MKKEIFYCDICNNEVSDLALIKESIPIINKIYVTGGRGNVKLAYMGEALEFEKQELCPECMQKYKQLWTHYMARLAQDWKRQTELIKSEIK